PFSKIAVQLRSPNTADDAKPEQLEFLGDGQQFIVAGILPDTKRPYSWNGGGEIGAVMRSELPEITEAEARELIEDAANLLTSRFGYTRQSRSKPKIKVVCGLESPQDGSDVHRDSDPDGDLP